MLERPSGRGSLALTGYLLSEISGVKLIVNVGLQAIRRFYATKYGR